MPSHMRISHITHDLELHKIKEKEESWTNTQGQEEDLALRHTDQHTILSFLIQTHASAHDPVTPDSNTRIRKVCKHNDLVRKDFCERRIFCGENRMNAILVLKVRDEAHHERRREMRYLSRRCWHQIEGLPQECETEHFMGKQRDETHLKDLSASEQTLNLRSREKEYRERPSETKKPRKYPQD